MAAGTVALQSEMAFEIHLPKLIGLDATEPLQRLALRAGQRVDTAMAMKNAPKGADRGQFLAPQIAQAAAQFTRSPCGLFSPQREHHCFHPRFRLITAARVRSGFPLERRLPIGRESCAPLVAGLPTDSKAAA